jgi:integration host factor subunit beta
MTKSELIDAVAQRTKITKSRAEQVVNCVFDSMTQAMEQSEGIEIRGFGSFSVRDYPPYSGRNPRTGKPVHVAAKRLPFFKVGKELKELVNQPRANETPGGSEGGRAAAATASGAARVTRDADVDDSDDDDSDDD